MRLEQGLLLCNTGRVAPHSSKPVPGPHLGVGAHLFLVYGGADFQCLALHRAVECTCERGRNARVPQLE